MRQRVVAALAAISAVAGLLILVNAPVASATITGTTVFDVDFGNGVGKDAVSSDKVTEANGHVINLVPGNYTEQSDSVTMAAPEGWNDPDGANAWMYTDANPAYGYSLDPFSSDFEFTVKVKVGTTVNALDSTNIFQKGFYTDPGQYKLQMENPNEAGNDGTHPECRFNGDAGDHIVTSTVSVLDGSYHTITCTRDGTDLSIKVDATTTTDTGQSIGTIQSTTPLRLANKLNQATTDGCATCQFDYANVVIETPHVLDVDPPVDVHGVGVVDVDFRNKNAADVDILDGDVTGGANSERIFKDDSGYGNDLYFKGTATFSKTNNGRKQYLVQGANGDRSVTNETINDGSVQSSSLNVGSNAFRADVRFALGTTVTGDNQVVFEKGSPSAGEGNFRLRIIDGTTTPQCVFWEGASGTSAVTVTATGVSLGTGNANFHDVGCFRDDTNLGIIVDSEVKGIAEVAFSPNADGNLNNGNPLVIGRSGTGLSSNTSACDGCRFDDFSMEVRNPDVRIQPWTGQGSGGSSGTWTKRASYGFNGGYSGTSDTVGDGTSNHFDMAVNNDFTDINGDAGRNVLKFAKKSAGLVSNDTLLNPGSTDFRVQSTFLINAMNASQPAPVIQKGTSGEYWRQIITADGRMQCIFGGTTTAKTLTSNVYVNDGKYHSVTCARWSGTLSIKVDGQVLRDTTAVGSMGGSSDVIVANKVASGGTGSDYDNGTYQAKINLDAIDIWKTWAS